MGKELLAVKWLPSIEYLEDHLHALGWHKVVQCKNCMYWQNGLYCEMSHSEVETETGRKILYRVCKR